MAQFLPYLVVVVAIFALAGFIYSPYAAWKRRDELSAWAARNALRFTPDRLPDMVFPYLAIKFLNEGDGRYACNLMDGTWAGRSFRAFDYHYSTGSGRSRKVHDLSVVVLKSRVPLQPLLIRKEGITDRLAGFLGFDEIKFESAEFSRAFHVSSPDRKWAYDVLHPRAMEFLLSMPRFQIQFDIKAVVVHRDTRFNARDFEDAAKVAQGLLDGLPEYVKEQQEKERA